MLFEVEIVLICWDWNCTWIMYLWWLWHGYIEMYVIYPLRRFCWKTLCMLFWDLLKMWQLFLEYFLYSCVLSL